MLQRNGCNSIIETHYCKSNKHDCNGTLEFFVVLKINEIEWVKYFSFSISQHPQKIKLEDPYFNKPQKIDALLGVECFYELLMAGQIHLPNSELIFLNSVSGFIAIGVMFSSSSEKTVQCELMTAEIDLND